MAHVVVIGAGIFGVTAALSLRGRGHEVTLADPGSITSSHPLAESTDISKIVRLDYGSDEIYTAMMEAAIGGWRRWASRWASPLFHETGVMFLTRRPMAPGGFEHDSFELLTRRGHRLERLDGGALRRRFPAWNAGVFVDGYWHAQGGWAESGAVVERLAREASDAGIRLAPGFRATRLLESGDRVTGAQAEDGARILGDWVVVAAGSWTQHLVPSLAPHFRSVGQPVFHLTPQDGARFDVASFPVFGADIANTGYYGFPRTSGVVKIANHGIGRELHPERDPREVQPEQEAALRAFLADAIPELTGAPLARTRVCVYGDTWDQHFWIAPDPNRRGLVVAAGGSGHGFKFAPLIGDWAADALEGKVVERFRWRSMGPGAKGQEQARHQT
jgi:glycine/D-amino acid oxidase-like deaminating enzyme